MGSLARHVRGNVVAYVALFSSLCLGGAWAASELGKNDVKSRHIGKGQVKTGDLGKNAVNSVKVRDASLLEQDFAPGQLPSGPPGDNGAQGPPGPTFGSFSAGTENPVPNPDSQPAAGSVRRHDFTLPSQGPVLAVASANVSPNCSTGIASYGLFVDGTSIPGTGGTVPDGATEYYAAFGVSQVLAPGQHSLTIGVDCLTGDFISSVHNELRLGVILLGS